MTKSMYDCAFLPSPPPVGFDVAGGYVFGAGAAHIWTAQDWLRAASKSRWLLPIATCWPPFGDGALDADAAIAAWQGHAPPPHHTQPCAFALDVEAQIASKAPEYIQQWRAEMRRRGYFDIVYSSTSAIPYLGAGPKWIALGSWNTPGVVIVQAVLEQLVQGHMIDVDIALDSVPFFDTTGAPVPIPPSGGKMFVDMEPFPDGTGYWLVKDDGAVFTFGDQSRYHGGANGQHLAAPICAIRSSHSGNGYYLLGEDGGVFAFGDAHYLGNGVGK